MALILDVLRACGSLIQASWRNGHERSTGSTGCPCPLPHARWRTPSAGTGACDCRFDFVLQSSAYGREPRLHGRTALFRQLTQA